MSKARELRALEIQLSKVGLEDAQRAVAEAQRVLTALREEAETAQRKVSAAAGEVKAAKAKQQHPEVKKTDVGGASEKKDDQYSDKAFWESRYLKAEMMARGAAEGGGFYEWYLDFKQWRPHLLEHIPYLDRTVPVLVAGCGNSSLCEDFAQEGFSNVAGFDYSSAVIMAMQKKQSKVRYFEADARNLYSEANDSFGYIVDKGTLDAIASGGGGDDSDSAQDAVRYMLQVWRVLKCKGKFVVLSTMPPDVFFALAVKPLRPPKEKLLMCDWDGAEKKCIKTPEGGEVYQYVVSKLSTPSKVQMEELAAKKLPPHKDDFMGAIQALLEEAKSAKEELGSAHSKCNEKTAETLAALNSLNATEKERDSLESKLRMSEQAAFDDEKPSIEAASATKVVLTVLPDESCLMAGGFAVVEYTLLEGGWNEDDAIHLVCSSDSSRHSEIYKPTDSERYEQLEYTNAPARGVSKTKSSLVGRVKLTLPTFCAFMSAHYVRTVTEVLPVIKRTVQTLAQSDCFLIPAPVNHGNPDSSSLVVKDDGILDISGRSGALKGLRRRCSGIMSFDEFTITIEDLRSIKSLNFSISHRDSYLCISRVMAWAQSGNTGGDNKFLELIVEADVALFDEKGSVFALHTSYAKAVVPVRAGIAFNLAGAQIELGTNGQVDEVPIIVCRIPYSSTAQLNFLPAKLRLPPISSSASAAVCGFCGNEIVAKMNISQVTQLPSGLLDNVMHEFICSAVAPTMSMCMSDLSTPKSGLMIGVLHANANPSDISQCGIVLACKDTPTLLDLFSGSAGSLATTPLPNPDHSMMTSSSLVNIDTCLVLCARCGSYIGDGQIAADCCPCPTHAPQTDLSNTGEPSSSPDNYGGSGKGDMFVLSDLRDVRMAKHCVELSIDGYVGVALDEENPLLREAVVSSEQAVARIMIHLNSVFTVATFVLFVPQKPKMQLVVLRILSRDFGVSLSEDSGLFREAIKVSFRIDHKGALSLTGTEARIPLQNHEMQAITKGLIERSPLFGPSILKNHYLSVLFK